MQITEYDLAYLLKELEIQFEIESKARDRAEQMVQYLLTTLAATFGATLLLIQAYSLLLILYFAVLLIYLFSVTSFYRTCRLRTIITQTRVARHLIRAELEAGNGKQAHLLAGIDQEPSGFSNRMINSLRFFAIACSALGSIVFLLGSRYLIEEPFIGKFLVPRYFIYFGAALVRAFGTAHILFRVIENFKRISQKLIQDQGIEKE
jgi:hypothetical protein